MKPTVLVLGSGPIRIGQGIEFDYSCVHCVWALREMGYRAIIVNNNPETVSTDFDTGDGLYFEPVTLEDVLDVIAHEQPLGVVTQFGGQTAINLAEPLSRMGVRILGTPSEAIALAEDRDLFEQLLARLDVPKPEGRAARSFREAREVAESIGYPVLVRPSFVLGGRAMEIVYSPNRLEFFFAEAEAANPGQPVLVDRYVRGREAEVDVVSDGIDTLVAGIMEHIERAGVHSGDSMAVYPPVTLEREIECRMIAIARGLARELGVRGLMNVQFVIDDRAVYVLEVNPRASRTVPFMSKVTGVPMVQLATRVMMGDRLADLGYGDGIWCAERGPDEKRWEPGTAFAPRGCGRMLSESEWLRAERRPPLYAVKAPVFSFQKLTRVEPSLGPEMKSTGEVLGIDPTYEGAMYKALVASGIRFRGGGRVLLSVDDPDKPAAVDIARRLAERGYALAATPGTHRALASAGLDALIARKIRDGSPNLLDLIRGGGIGLLINTPSPDESAEQEGARIRRACIEAGIACVTSIDTARALVQALDVFADPRRAECRPYTEYLAR